MLLPRRSLRLLSVITLLVSSSSVYALRTELVPSGPYIPLLTAKHQMETADFNGDGIPDLVTSSEVVSTRVYSILLDVVQSDGTLGNPVTLYSSGFFSNFAIADVDRDGKSDIVFADYTAQTIVALLANGDGTFRTVSTATPFAVSQMVCADFDEDGFVDVAIGLYNTTTLAILHGDGSGTFTEVSPAERVTVSPAIVTLAGGDVDGDGHADIVIRSSLGSPSLSVLFGAGNASFASQATIRSATDSGGYGLLVRDLDGDGDGDILTTEYSANTLTVTRALPGRTFAASEPYVVRPAGYGVANPMTLAVADVDGDGKLDLVVALLNFRTYCVMYGHGDGSFDLPFQMKPPPVANTIQFVYGVATADFNHDGRADVFVGTDTTLWLMRSAAGDTVASAKPRYNVISAGQTAPIVVQITPPSTYTPFFLFADPSPTGVVRVKLGDTVVGTGTLGSQFNFNGVATGAATVNVDDLPVGDTTFDVEYDGDANYAASTTTVTQHVTSETSTITLASNENAEIVYGTQIVLTPAVTSSIPGSVSGSISLYIDDQLTNLFGNPYIYVDSLPVGTHSIYALYQGNDTHPPAKSNVITQSVRKRTPVVTLAPLPGVTYVAPDTMQRLDIGVQGPHADSVGRIFLYDGDQLLQTLTPPNGSGSFISLQVTPGPALGVGTHYLRAVYEGDANLSSATGGVTVKVFPSNQFLLDAVVQGDAITVFTAGAPAGTHHYRLYSRVGRAAWQSQVTFSSVFNQSSPLLDAVYVYKVEAYDSAEHLLGTTNSDLVVYEHFTDDPVLIGMPIKAVHLTELFAATNLLRSSAGLAPIAFDDIGQGFLIRAQHFAGMRGAINEARAALGVDPVAFDTNVAAGVVIRMVDLMTLRAALR
jgi:hypothetical protein